MKVAETLSAIRDSLERVILGHPRAIEHVLIALVSGGHILMEDVPGVGKTTLARALAKTVEAQFQRVQFTPDLLPADLLGVSIYNSSKQEFEFKKGPIFTNVLLADEINRASPRTQSAMLEAMSEKQVTVDGVTYELAAPYIVLATQNPAEFQGTYPLPEAQLDRFLIKTSLGYPDAETETDILFEQSRKHPLEAVEPCIDCKGVLELQELALDIKVERSVARYMVDIVEATRAHPAVSIGASPRGSLALFQTARALALIRGRDYVLPDDVKELADPTLSHRLILNLNARHSGTRGQQVVEEVLTQVKSPS